MNVVVAMPLRVWASTGSIRPSVVVKRTSVPLCTGVPLDSMTVAVTSVVPPVGTTRLCASMVTDELVGARSGIESQLRHTNASTTTRLK